MASDGLRWTYQDFGLQHFDECMLLASEARADGVSFPPKPPVPLQTSLRVQRAAGLTKTYVACAQAGAVILTPPTIDADDDDDSSGARYFKGSSAMCWWRSFARAPAHRPPARAYIYTHSTDVQQNAAWAGSKPTRESVHRATG